MKILSSQDYQGLQVEVKSPETPEDFAYICNLAVGQKLYVSEKYVFYKLLTTERKYIKQIAAMSIDDALYGLAIIWDYTKRVVDLGFAGSEQEMKDYGFLQNAVGVFVPKKQRGGLIGSLMANYITDLFGEDVFCVGDSIEEQAFWTSPRVDKTHIKFMLTEKATVRINF